MQGPVPPGAPRQQPPPPNNYNNNPNYQQQPNNPNSLSDNRPTFPPNSAPRQSSPFPSSRPGPPPPATVPRPSSGSPPPTLPNARPSGPPFSHPSPFGSRPPPASLPSPTPPAYTPQTQPQYARPAPPVAPSLGGGMLANGPPAPPFQGGGPQFPPSAAAPQPPLMGPPTMGPSRPPGTRPLLANMGISSGQQRPPFSSQGPPFSVPPPQGMSQFSPPPQGMSPPVALPFGQQIQSQQVAPPPIMSGTQPPGLYAMPPPPPLPNQMTAISPLVGQPGGPMAAPSKIDPNQIPRPIPSSSVVLHDTRSQNQANPPPPATSDYIVNDTGNCSPRYMRCTINQIPCTVDLVNTSGMQLSLLVQPLALPHPSEEPVQLVDFGESGPVRCSRCKGYINPFMKFIDQGRRFICNLCGFTDETPRDYHCNLGPDGRRRDADERPELCRGTVEFVATKEYTVREPMPAVYFFLIDVSMHAIKTGATAAACGSINQVIADLPEGPRTMVGIATFDSTIHFYNLKRALQQPLMLIVPDVQDVYTPLQTDVIVPVSECRQHLELLLESIPSMFGNSKTAESAFGAAIKAAFLAMKSTGGKLMVFQSVLPSIGIGALSAREAEGRSNISAGEKEAHKLLQPADKTLKELAIEFAEYQVCVDVFITTHGYVDISSISVIPKTTGGQVYYYFPFSSVSDPAKLYNDLRWNVTRPQGFEAVMRVRCSQGIQVQQYHGNFCKRIPTDVDLPGIDCDKTIMVTLKHDDKLPDGSECAFQCALLYTTVYGQRRIRVTTLSLPCTTNLSNLFRMADLDTQFVCFLKQAANDIPSTPPLLVREQVTNFCINILLAYRKFCATVSSSGQLILPEALKLLPLYTLALIKSIGLRIDGKIDERSYWITYVSSVSVPLAIPLVHPRMIPVHDLDTQEGNDTLIPQALPLSSEHVSDDGIYLLENGQDGLIYIGNSVSSSMLQQLFGISSVDEIPAQFVLQLYENPLSKKLNDVVNEIRRRRCSYLRLKLCKKGDMGFFSYLIEDKVPTGGLSYVEFLVHIHRQIQLKMSA
ncbi:Sec23/Sec24 protein transport family protein [Euphorbia peplus]|nr:Sec23/Sec24 protein transport family protein [Euphorbia peplus]